MAFDTSTPYSTMMSYRELANQYKDSDPDLSAYYSNQAETWSKFVEAEPPMSRDEAAKQVTQIYEEELGRAPDAGGLDFYVQQIVNGVSVDDIAKQIDASNEGSGFDQEVRDLVSESVGRINKDNFNQAYEAAIDSGYTKEQFFDAIGAELVTDAAGKTAVSFVPNQPLTQGQQNLDAIKSIYQQEFGRAPDQEGLVFYLQKLESGTPLAQVRSEIKASEEARLFDETLGKQVAKQYGAITGDNLNKIVNDLQKQGYSFEQVADAIGGTISTNEKGESVLSYTPPTKTFTNDEIQKLITDQFGSVTPQNFQEVVNAVTKAGVPADQFASVVGATIGTNDKGDTTLSLPAQETKPLSLVDQLKAQQQVTGITHQASFSKDQDAIIKDMAEKLGKYGVQSLEDLKPITGEKEYFAVPSIDDNGNITGYELYDQNPYPSDGPSPLPVRQATASDIAQLQSKGTITENVGVLNARTGQEIPVNELNNAKGSGFTYYKIEFSPDGVAVPYGFKEATGAGALGDQIKSIASLPPIAAALAAVTAGTLNIQGPGMFELGLSKPAAAALGAFTSTSIATGDLVKAAQAAILAGGSTYALQEAGLIKPGVTKPLEELTLSDFEGSGTGFGDTTDISASDIRNILNQSGTTVSSLSQANPITAAAADITVPIFGQGAQLAGVVPAGGITALQLGSGLTPKVEVTSARDTGSTAGATAGAVAGAGSTLLDKGVIQISGQGTKLNANAPASLATVLTGGYQPIETSPYTVNVTGTKLDASTPAAGGTAIVAKPSTTQLVSDLATGKKSVTDLTSEEVETLIKAGLLVTTLVGSAVDTGGVTIPTTNVDTTLINTIRPGVKVDLNPTIPGATTTTLTPGQQTYNLLGINAGTPTTQPTVPTTGIGSLPVPTYKPPPFLGGPAPGASRITPPVLTADPTLTQADFETAAKEIARQQAALPPITQPIPATPFESGLAKGTTVVKRAGGIVALRGGGIPMFQMGGPVAFAYGGMTAPVNQPRMLSGGGDGMSDSIPATIDGTQPARLADGEFVIPADVVADIGNGSSKAGAKQLYAMMDRVRQARHGTTKQPPEVNMKKVLPV